MIGARRLADAAGRVAHRASADKLATHTIDEADVAAVREQWTATRTAIEAEFSQV